ncbi:MAG: hypothetical protein NTX56_16425 [Proteobacteria bacterium]|nr:hypothetical protein [Pseudomonadota bacterium]
MDELKTIESLGFTIPSAAYIVGAIFFSIIGYAGYRFGKAAERDTPRWIGIVLMLYPYAISETWLMYAVGAALCVALYVTSK